MKISNSGVGNAFMHSGDFGTKSHCRKAIVTNFPAGNPKMLCIFGGTDKSVPYNPIVIWSIAKQQFEAKALPFGEGGRSEANGRVRSEYVVKFPY